MFHFDETIKLNNISQHFSSEATETISLAPQLFKKHNIWGRSAASQLITLPLKGPQRLSNADPSFSR